MYVPTTFLPNLPQDIAGAARTQTRLLTNMVGKLLVLIKAAAQIDVVGYQQFLDIERAVRKIYTAHFTKEDIDLFPEDRTEAYRVGNPNMSTAFAAFVSTAFATFVS